uniref:Fe2OG dioxygenase domain-containing protein n=1 Tax=Chrysotila carterae TaxID=13221 RepID=A0A7S4AYU3_CHRCT
MSVAGEQVAVDSKGSQASMISSARSRTCKDEVPDCLSLTNANLTGCAENPRLLALCSKTCGSCYYRSLVDEATKCEDANENCKLWADSGECDANPSYMLQHCTVACDACAAKQNGCARKQKQPALFPPSDMDAMFKRALSDFPQFSPTALSTDPWVIQFENVVTAEEAAIMTESCPKFERSLAGDQLSPVRTSTQCWCGEGECLQNENVHAVTERILNITQVPFNNAEYFQVLKYEPGQFYKAHHDQQSAHWSPQGVRLYTFFIYLSDVEAGGGTRFPMLDVTVTPKLGRAILWPSVFGHDLTTSDKRTTHEALPVEKGVKWAANLWQHLYDFKSPSRSGLCLFLGRNSNHE